MSLVSLGNEGTNRDNPFFLPQLSQFGIKIGVIDSARAVSFHHKTSHLAVGCISSEAVVWANQV